MKSRLLLLALFLLSCSRGVEVRVLAAASLSDVLTEIASAYERETGERVVLAFGGSSILARQIAAGAPADLFISADEAKMNALEESSLIVPGTRVPLLSNTLAVVVPADSRRDISTLSDLTSLNAIAIAEPSTVPAGIYARQHLQQAGLWEAVSTRVIPAENVRAALAAVEGGNADAAIVYATDVRIARRVRVALAISNGPRISYPAAVIAHGENVAGARRFLQHLRSAEAAAVFRSYGFIVRGSS